MRRFEPAGAVRRSARWIALPCPVRFIAERDGGLKKAAHFCAGPQDGSFCRKVRMRPVGAKAFWFRGSSDSKAGIRKIPISMHFNRLSMSFKRMKSKTNMSSVRLEALCAACSVGCCSGFASLFLMGSKKRSKLLILLAYRKRMRSWRVFKAFRRKDPSPFCSETLFKFVSSKSTSFLLHAA